MRGAQGRPRAGHRWCGWRVTHPARGSEGPVFGFTRGCLSPNSFFEPRGSAWACGPGGPARHAGRAGNRPSVRGLVSGRGTGTRSCAAIGHRLAMARSCGGRCVSPCELPLCPGCGQEPLCRARPAALNISSEREPCRWRGVTGLGGSGATGGRGRRRQWPGAPQGAVGRFVHRLWHPRARPPGLEAGPRLLLLL